ncbi:MAG: hypothetical protein U5L04_02415 [Trueperaceae bacterium]|nr:hypothetical protein [Trueperaceae bacterium]
MSDIIPADRIVDYDHVHDTVDSSDFEPLRVSCELVEDVVYFDDGLNLDGPLQWAVYAGLPRKVRDQLPLPNSQPWLPDFELPVAKWTCPVEEQHECDDRLTTPGGKLWGWCTTHVLGGWEKAGQAGVRKMAVDQPVKRWTDRKSVNLASGRFKPSDKTYPTRWTKRPEWHVLGDKDALEELLARVTHIGKLRGQGRGRLKLDTKGRPDWTVEPIGSFQMVRDGELLRRMPYGWHGIQRPARPMPVRAPHWHRCRWHLMMEADHV